MKANRDGDLLNTELKKLETRYEKVVIKGNNLVTGYKDKCTLLLKSKKLELNWQLKEVLKDEFTFT